MPTPAPKREETAGAHTPEARSRGIIFSSLITVTLVVVLLICTAVLCIFLLYRSDVSKGATALSEAYRFERPLEARISGLAYAPLANTRGANREEASQVSIDKAELLLLDAVFENPGAATHHSLGRFYLTEQQYDKAIGQFEESMKAGPNNAALHSDLGAALLERGKSVRRNEEHGNSIRDFAGSLAALDKALKLDESSLEAKFNRAILYEEMNLPGPAEAELREYIERDPNSGWAEETRRRLTQLEELKAKGTQDKGRLLGDFTEAQLQRNDQRAWEIVSQHRDLAGSLVENLLLDEYLNSAIEGRDERARSHLRTLSYAAALEIDKGGDRYLSDVVRFYGGATPALKRSLQLGRSLIRQGHEHLRKFQPGEALAHYDRAAKILAQIGDTSEARYINYARGHCFLLEHKSELGLAIFQELEQFCKANQYKWLLAQTYNAKGNAYTGLRDFSLALNSSNQSLALSESIGDTTGVIKTLNQLAGEYFSLHNYEKALGLHFRSLVLARSYPQGPMQLWRDYFSIARVLDKMGLRNAATAYQREALSTAIEGRMPQLVCRSFTYLGLLYGNQNEYDEAVRSIERAKEISESFSDKVARDETAAYSSLYLGDVHKRAGDFESALLNYDRAAQLFGELGSEYFTYVSRQARLLCCIARGGCASVEEEIEKTLELFEEHRSKILEQSNRDAFFDAEQDVYDVAIDYEYSIKNDRRRAFQYSESSRARSLRDLTSNRIKLIGSRDEPDLLFDNPTRPMSVEEIQQRLPENSVIVQYAVLKNKVLIWVLTRKDLHSGKTDISSEDLDEKVRRYVGLIASPAKHDRDDAVSQATDLYSALIGPIQSALDLYPDARLCIVPDKILNYLPFGALISRESTRYLVEERAFVISPSSSSHVFSSESALAKNDRRVEKTLSVGNPLFDSQAFPFLRDLPSAAREATAVARFYDSPAPLTDRWATKDRIETAMQKSDVIHLALHSVVNVMSPLRSKFVLAKSRSGNESDGILQASDIYLMDLSQARLVVLSACETGVGKCYAGEGMISISRPFLAKGVPVVVGSLWPVDSDSSAELMISFHRHRKVNGLSTVEALRRAQLDMLESPDRNHQLPYHWAAFVAIGGNADF